MAHKGLFAIPAFVVVSLAAMAVAAFLLTRYPEPVWDPVSAEVTRVSVSITKYHAFTHVALRTPTGVGEATLIDRPANCHVGDVVPAEQAGIAIRQTARTCT